jgi:folate-dependent phosphoribosylglycinamide formyltransferase PurN
LPILTLNDEHQYSFDGKPVDGLTSTIKEAGLIRGADEWYMTRGTAIHLVTEFYDKGTLVNQR